MLCRKCNKELEDSWKICPWCGRKQVSERHARTRANGEGSVFKYRGGYRAIITVGYELKPDGKLKWLTKSMLCSTRKDAVKALVTLRIDYEKSKLEKKKPKTSITFKALYDKWYPTHEASKSTMDCYKAAMRYFEPIWDSKMDDIDIDDLQECVDECGKGKRTQQNMKAVCGLIYKYGIPRQAVPENLNLAPFLKVRGEDASHRESFNEEQIAAIKALTKDPRHSSCRGARQVYCLIYLGFRPSEFLDLKTSSYDPKRKCIIGGAKTAAGKGRTVTVAPGILPFIESMLAKPEDKLVRDEKNLPYTLQHWTESVFYPILEAAGIDNPMVEIGEGQQRHKYSPHSCRHTFSTLMKRVEGADKDKLELIGHSSDEMLRYYQDVTIGDLKKITDKLWEPK